MFFIKIIVAVIILGGIGIASYNSYREDEANNWRGSAKEASEEDLSMACRLSGYSEGEALANCIRMAREVRNNVKNY